MAVLTVVEVLYCGQGMTTLVEIHRNGKHDGPPDFVALIDCGGNDAKYAVDHIAKRVAQQPQHTIGLLVVSHQDEDHWKRLAELRTKLPADAKVARARIGGGQAWTKKHTEQLIQFLTALGCTNPEYDPPNASDYKDPSHLGSIAEFAGVHLRLLITNVAGTGSRSSQANTPSAAVVVDDGQWTVVLPGDGTYQTMHQINELPDVHHSLHTVVGLEIPHHGSLTSLAQNNASGASGDADLTIVTEFAKKMAPKRVVASAGPYNAYHHPADVVIRLFDKTVLCDTTWHWYVAYKFTENAWKNYPARVAEYGTLQYLGRPPTDKPIPNLNTRFARVGEDDKGKLVYGDVVFRLAPPGVLRPEEVVEFRPRGTIGRYGADDVVLTAPAP